MEGLAKGSYVLMKDGTILVKKRGEPPKVKLPGYEQDSRDKWIYRPIYRDCNFRKEIPRELPCGKETIAHTCTLLHRDVSVNKCDECDLVNEDGERNGLPDGPATEGDSGDHYDSQEQVI